MNAPERAHGAGGELRRVLFAIEATVLLVLTVAAIASGFAWLIHR